MIVFSGDRYSHQPTIRNAKDLYEQVMKYRKNLGWEELVEYAKKDLEDIFEIDKSEIKEMTTNRIYLEHQSKMINSIFDMLRKEQ